MLLLFINVCDVLQKYFCQLLHHVNLINFKQFVLVFKFYYQVMRDTLLYF